MEINGVFVADWFFYSLVGISCFIVFVVVWWFYNARLKIGYKAVFTKDFHAVNVLMDGKLKKLGGVPVALGEKEFKASDKTVSWRGKEFKIDLGKPAYRWWGWTRFYFDFDSGNVKTFGGEFQGVNPDDADVFLNTTLVGRVVSALKEKRASILMYVLMIVVFSVMAYFLGLLSSPYVMPTLDNLTRSGGV